MGASLLDNPERVPLVRVGPVRDPPVDNRCPRADEDGSGDDGDSDVAEATAWRVGVGDGGGGGCRPHCRLDAEDGSPLALVHTIASVRACQKERRKYIGETGDERER